MELIPKELASKLGNVFTKNANPRKEAAEIYKTIGFSRLSMNCVLMRQIVMTDPALKDLFLIRLDPKGYSDEVRGHVLNFLFQKLGKS